MALYPIPRVALRGELEARNVDRSDLASERDKNGCDVARIALAGVVVVRPDDACSTRERRPIRIVGACRAATSGRQRT